MKTGNVVGLVGWRGMVGSVLMDRMQAERDFDLIEPIFFSTSNAGGAAPAQARNERQLKDAHDIEALKKCDIIHRLRPHTGPTQGGAFFVCLNSSLPRRLAHCPLRQLPVCNVQGSRCISHPTHFIGGLVHVRITFVLQYLRPGFQQGARRTPHSRLWCLLNTMPLPSRDLALASWHQH